MALIACPECGKEISDTASSCPNCGAPIAQKNETKSTITTRKLNLQKLFAVLVIIISLIALIALKGSVFWSLLFFAGIVWFVVLRILKD